MAPRQTLGELLHAAREVRDLTVADAATRLGVAPSTLRRWEADELAIGAGALARVLALYEVSASTSARALALAGVRT